MYGAKPVIVPEDSRSRAHSTGGACALAFVKASRPRCEARQRGAVMLATASRGASGRVGFSRAASEASFNVVYLATMFKADVFILQGNFVLTKAV